MPDSNLAAWISRREGRGLDPRQLRFWQVVLNLPEAQVDVWLEGIRSSPEMK